MEEPSTTPIAWRLAVYVLYQKPENIHKELLSKFVQLFTMILDCEWGEDHIKERILFLTHFIIEADPVVVRSFFHRLIISLNYWHPVTVLKQSFKTSLVLTIFLY